MATSIKGATVDFLELLMTRNHQKHGHLVVFKTDGHTLNHTYLLQGLQHLLTISTELLLVPKRLFIKTYVRHGEEITFSCLLLLCVKP